jgi:nucleoside-diphosphate-sugar epimerase
MKILISGASGLIGKAITDYFQNDGHEILPLQRKNPAITPYWNIEKQVVG